MPKGIGGIATAATAVKPLAGLAVGTAGALLNVSLAAVKAFEDGSETKSDGWTQKTIAVANEGWAN